MKHSHRGLTLSRSLTGASLSALMIGAGLAAMPAAQAVPAAPTNHFVTSVDESETRATGHNDFGAEGVRVYTEGATSTDKAAGYFAVNTPLADVGEPSMDVVASSGNLLPSTQLVVDFDNDGSPDGILVGEPKYADGSNLYGDNWWASNGSKQFVKDDAPSHGGGFGSDNNGTLDQWRTNFPDAKVLNSGWSLGSGVKGDATIYSISLGSDNYFFSAAPTAASDTVVNSDLRGSETAATYSKWHQGYANATVHAQVNGDGLVLAGQSQIIKGFTNHTNTLNTRNINLLRDLPSSGMTLAAGSDPVAFQVVVYFQNPTSGGVKFATLRAESTTAEHKTISLDDNWQATRQVGSIAANTDAKLGDLIKALGQYKVIAFGVQTDPGSAATVKSYNLGATSYTFADPADDPTDETVSTIAPNEDTYEGWHQGADEGHATIADGLLNLGSTRSQVINGYADNSNDVDHTNVNLADALRTASYTVDSGTVSFQVPLFFTDPVSGETKFTTLRPTAGAGAGTHSFTINDQWTSSKAIGNVVDANGSARLADILSSLGDYKVLGFGVFSNAGDNGVVKDITWDGVKYGFSVNTVKTTASVKVNSAGEAVVNISCTEACSGYAQLRSDEAGTKTSANVFYYKLSKAGYMPMQFTGLTNANADWKVRIAVASPIPGSGPSPQFNNIALTKGSTAAVNVVKTTAGAKVSASGKIVVNVSCTKACTGYAQLWSDGQGDAKSSNVIKYTLTKAGYKALTFTGMPTGTAKWFVRLAITAPTPVAGTTPVFHDLNLL